MRVKLRDFNEEERKAWELLRYCRSFIEENEIRAPESIYQVDSINLALPEFTEKICDIVGYDEAPED